jgi:hypothetical protein
VNAIRSLVAGTLAGAVGGLPATAAEWSAAPSVAWTVDHQSNRELQPEGEKSQGAFVSLDLLLKRATEVSEISIRPHVQLQRFNGDTVADADNASLTFNTLRRGERHSLSAQVRLVHENTLTGELADSGLVGRDTTRDLSSMAAAWSHELSERHIREVQLSYARLEYDGDLEAQLPGYRYPSVALVERFELSARAALAITAFGSELQSGAQLDDMANYGAQLSFDRQLTPRFTARIALGFSDTEIGPVTENGYVAEMSLRREIELGFWSFDYRHSVAASGRGVLVERDRLSLSVQRALSPRMVGRLELQSVHNDDLGVRLSGERRRYDAVEAGLDWRLARTWSLGWRVGALRANSAFGGERGEGWRTSLFASWSPRPWTISR